MNMKLDKILTRGANLSQIVLIFGALFGYFYTVKPLYQKELLDEAIARKEVE